MSDYTKTTDFAAKDALLTGNPSKTVLGAEIDAEFDNIETAVNTKLDDVLTTRGDIITEGASGEQRLPVGTAGYILRSDGTDPAWSTPYYACTAYRTTNDSIPNNSFTNMYFLSESFDSGTIHDVAVPANSHLFAAPSWATKMRMTGIIQWEANINGTRGFAVYDAADNLTTPVHSIQAPAAGVGVVSTNEIATGLLPITGGTSYKIKVYQNSGGLLNVGASYVTVEFFP